MESKVVLRIVGFVTVYKFVLLCYGRFSKNTFCVNYISNKTQQHRIFEFPNENVKMIHLYVYSWPNIEGCYKDTCIASYDLFLDKYTYLDSKQAENISVSIDMTQYMGPVVGNSGFSEYIC